MDRLAELLAPDDARDVISAAGDHWWLEVAGPWTSAANWSPSNVPML